MAVHPVMNMPNPFLFVCSLSLLPIRHQICFPQYSEPYSPGQIIRQLGGMFGGKESGCDFVWQRRCNGQSLDEYRQLKLLPHINEEYQFRITNKLLIEKIANPRRDRIIIDSLAHTSHSQLCRGRKGHGPQGEGGGYRRKIVLTAGRGKRQKASDSQLGERVREMGREGRGLSMKKSSVEGGNENEGWNESGEWPKHGQVAGGKGELRGSLVGKIVRNNSGYLMRLPKKGVLRNNYYFNSTCIEGSRQLEFPKEHSQHLIKRIARRIYQNDSPEKQNKLQ